MHVVLTYQDGASNWGARRASGVAEVVRAEGEARVSTHGLTAPLDTHLVVWLGRDGSTDSFRLGELIVGSDGNATLDVLLPDEIPDRGWNQVFITGETVATVDRPSNRRSLVGHYPQPNQDGPQPYGLPDTGVAEEG